MRRGCMNASIRAPDAGVRDPGLRADPTAPRPQKIASGCAGAPVDPTSRSGVAVNRNS